MIYGIIGDAVAPDKLVTAALNDQLEAHLQDDPQGPFRLCIAVHRGSPAIYHTIVRWAEKNEIFVSYYTAMSAKELSRTLEPAEAHEYKPFGSEVYMIMLVERLYDEVRTGETATLFALLGDKEPSIHVRRALARAVDNNIEVRDLAEAGLTYVGVADNPIQTKGSNDMSDDTMTIEQAGEAADEGDEEAIEELTRMAAQYELDPDEYETWTLLAETLRPLLVTGDEAEVEEEASAPAPRKTKPMTQEQLEDTPVPDLRVLAKQMGVEGWEKNRSAKLIEGILEAQANGDAPVRSVPAIDSEVAEGFGELIATESILPALARGLRAFADALEG